MRRRAIVTRKSVLPLSQLLSPRRRGDSCDCASTRFAEAQAVNGRRLLTVQHHHAHLASCTAEIGFDEPHLATPDVAVTAPCGHAFCKPRWKPLRDCCLNPTRGISWHCCC